MANPLLQTPWESSLLEPVSDGAMTRWLRREAGQAPAWSRHFWTVPWFAKAAVRLDYVGGKLVELDFDLAILVGLVVSQENSCRYCYAMTRMVMRLLGISEERVAAIEHSVATEGLPARSAAAVRFARALNRGNQFDGPTERARLAAAGFSEGETRELAYVVAVMGFLNRLTTISALSPTVFEQLPDRWYVQLLGPLVTPLVKRMLRHGKPTRSAPIASPLPDALRIAYAGSPIADVLADSLRDLWASRALPQRAKLLVMATLAQGLECKVCRDEIARLARGEGLDADALERAAAHLDDPALSAQERQLCAFARASLWYTPQDIQRKARALRDSLGVPAFVEVLGVVALGNLLMRLLAALEPAA